MKLLLNNHGGDTQVSKHMQTRCFNWFRLAFAGESENREDLITLAEDMLSVQFGVAKRKDIIRIALYKVQNGICNLCGQRFPIQLFAIDHIDAKSKSNNDRLDNFQVLCSACNSWKGDRPMHRMLDLRRKLDLPVYEAVYYGQNDPISTPIPQEQEEVQTNGAVVETNGETDRVAIDMKDWEFVEAVVLENSPKPMPNGEITSVCLERNMWGNRTIPKYPSAAVTVALKRALGLNARDGSPISEEAVNQAKIKVIHVDGKAQYVSKNGA